MTRDQWIQCSVLCAIAVLVPLLGLAQTGLPWEQPVREFALSAQTVIRIIAVLWIFVVGIMCLRGIATAGMMIISLVIGLAFVGFADQIAARFGLTGIF
jgi:hypothetical protein